MSSATIVSFVLVPYVAPFILFFIALAFWLIAVSFEVISFGFILLAISIVILIFAPSLISALPLITGLVVVALLIWGISVFFPFVPNYNIMPTLISITTFLNTSFLFSWWLPNLTPIIDRMNRFNYVGNDVPSLDTFCFLVTFSNTGFLFLSAIGVGLAAVIFARFALSTFIYVGELVNLVILLFKSIRNDEAFDYDIRNKREMKEMKKAIVELREKVKEKNKKLKETVKKLKEKVGDTTKKIKEGISKKADEVKVNIKDLLRKKNPQKVPDPIATEMFITGDIDVGRSKEKEKKK